MAKMGHDQHHCSVTGHSPGFAIHRGLIPELLLRDFSLPWQAVKWAGSTLQQNWHHHCQCLAFYSTPLLETSPAAVQDGQKQKYLPLSNEWIPSPETAWTKSEVVMSFQKYVFQKSPSQFSTIPIPVELPSILQFYFPASQKELGRRKRHYSWRVILPVQRKVGADSGHSVIKTDF